jgi:hypothetical protein
MRVSLRGAHREKLSIGPELIIELYRVSGMLKAIGQIEIVYGAGGPEHLTRPGLSLE